MDQAERVESGLHKLSRFIQAASLPYAHQFLDALDLSASDSAALARAVEELYRPTSLDSEHALFAFEASHPRADVQAFGDLGNRIVESHSQFLATGAWSHVLKRLHESSPTTFDPPTISAGAQSMPTSYPNWTRSQVLMRNWQLPRSGSVFECCSGRSKRASANGGRHSWPGPGQSSLVAPNFWCHWPILKKDKAPKG